jgi:L-malate glycosyltransferase
MEKRARIIAVHLLNDISGSPLVFSMDLSDYKDKGHEVILYTSKGPGFLSQLNGIRYRNLPYSWNKSKRITLINFLMVQAYLFFGILFTSKKNDCVYVNTLLPFGALLAAKIRGIHTIQHMHEVSVRPALLFKFLCLVSEYCTKEMVFVSHYLKSCFQFQRPVQTVVHNRLSKEFLAQVESNPTKLENQSFTALMLCSLKEYKGVFVFTRLAKDLPEIRFKLVLNASLDAINEFIKNEGLPPNCEVLQPTTNTHQYYRTANVLLNLSLPDQWIETFGMTILEAKAYGLKVIAPPVGGPAEIVNEPVDGWLIDSRNYEQLRDKLLELSSDYSLESIR